MSTIALRHTPQAFELAVTPPNPTFATSVQNLNLSRPQTDHLIAKIREALVTYKLLNFRDQRTTPIQHAGGVPSRISRRAFVRGRAVLTALFFAVLIAPMGLAFGAEEFGIGACGVVAGRSCGDIHSVAAQMLTLGGPALALAIFVFGNALLSIWRAHDLDLDLSFCRACRGTVAQPDALQRRLGSEEGTPGPNRFGPPPSGAVPTGEKYPNRQSLLSSLWRW